MSLWQSNEYGAFSAALRAKSVDAAPDTILTLPAVPAGTSVDEFGRPEVEAPAPSFIKAFTPRVEDRISNLSPPWNGAMIAHALLATERGDLSRQAELGGHMEERDGKLAGFLQSRRLHVAGVEWYCAPPATLADDAEAQEIAAFAEAEIRAIPNFAHGFRDMHDAIGQGIAALNIGWQRGGRTRMSNLHVDSLDWINTRRIRFDWKTDRLLLVPDEHLKVVDERQLAFDDITRLGLGIQPGRWDVLVHRSRMRTTHPAKGGAFRTLVYYFLFRNLAIKEWFNFANIYGTPFRLGKLPAGATEDDRNEMLAALARLGKDGAAVIDALSSIEFLESKQVAGGKAEPPFQGLRQECAEEMEFCILGQNQTNSEHGNGSRAKTEAGGAKVVQTILEADCIDDMASMTNGLVKPIVGFSRYGWLKAKTKLPEFRMRYKPQKDFKGMSDVDRVLHGELCLPTTAGQLAERYERKLPEGVDPDTVMFFNSGDWPGIAESSNVIYISSQPPQLADEESQAIDEEEDSPATENRRSATKAMRLVSKRSGRTNRTQQTIDDYNERAIDVAARAFERLPAPVQQILTDVTNEGKGLDEVQRRVMLLTPDDLDDGGEIEELLRRAAGTLRLLGMSTVRKAPKEIAQ